MVAFVHAPFPPFGTDLEDTAMTFVAAFRDLPALVSTELPASDWLTIDQDRIDRFAEATGDRQWIHVDVERAAREAGGTIAHGFLTLSLMATFSMETFDVTGATRRINYGFERLRFTEPVRCGDRIRLSHRLTRVEEKTGGLMLTRACAIEIEGRARPALFADWLILVLP